MSEQEAPVAGTDAEHAQGQQPDKRLAGERRGLGRCRRRVAVPAAGESCTIGGAGDRSALTSSQSTRMANNRIRAAAAALTTHAILTE
jgi:hypothetical protein